jgi:hypothetical protein
MQVKPAVPPHEPSGLDFRVDVGRLEEVLDVVDTTIEVEVEVLDELAFPMA